MILELVMIVKNSGDVLRDCLKSVKPYIDRWTILDTGSSDRTSDIIKEELNGIEGNLYNEPFIDFSTTRNRAFELSTKTCKYMIVLDDSYELCGGNELRNLLKTSTISSYSLKIGEIRGKCLDNSYYSLRVVKTDSNLRYKGRVHEAIYCQDNQVITNTNIYINDIQDSTHLLRTRQRLDRDIKGLLLDEKENPDNPRTLYYLSRTYAMKQEYRLAIVYCDKLESLENIHREYKFYAVYEKANLKFEMNGDKQSFKKSMFSIQKKFQERSEPMYKLAVSLYDEGKYEEVVRIMDRLIVFPKPIVMITILETSIYDYYIPYLYIESHFKIGQFEKVIPILREMLDKYPTDQMMLNMKYVVCDKTQIIPQRLTNNSTVVIHMGGFFRPWNPKKETTISGSEYMAINMAKELTRIGYRVIMFGFFEKDDINYQGMYDNIQYIDYTYFPEFSIKYVIDYLIVSRHVENLVYYDNIRNVYLWAHDVLPIFQKHAPLFQIHFKKFRGIITLSNWQKNFIKQKVGLPDSYLILSRNAIYAERFLQVHDKIPYRFIYMSDAKRGLVHLIRMMPRIKEKYPLTTLYIFTKSEFIDTELLSDIQNLDYVTLQQRVSQDVISNELLKSDVWLYPTDFEETYCISALEAMAAGCLVATVKYAGLEDTVSKRGILCNSPIEDNYDELLKKLFFVLDHPDVKERYVSSAREWALSQTYQRLALEWKSMFSSHSVSSIPESI